MDSDLEWFDMFVFSDEPLEEVSYFKQEQDDNLDEVTVLKLKNKRYVLINFSGLTGDRKHGVLFWEEFDTKKSAVKVFNQFVGDLENGKNKKNKRSKTS